MKSICSRYEDHFFSITALVVDFKQADTPPLAAMKAVFRSNLKKQSSMVLVREVPLPQGHACKSTSYQCSGLMGRIPVQTWSFVGVLSEETKMGFIVTFVSSEWAMGRRNEA